jgi:hypothetical protein
MVATLNGTHVPTDAGRYVKPLPFYTFRSSGLSVQVRRISPSTGTLLMQGIIKECKALPEGHEHVYPKPPVYDTEVGPEPNENDADFIAAKTLWLAWAEQEAATRLLRLIAADYVSVPAEVVTEALERLQRSLRREGAELEPMPIDMERYSQDEADRMQYLFSCCMLDPQRDGQDFLQFVFGQSQPQEEQIQAYQATFQSPRN